jgi:arsenate reductase (thioredoxin)
VLVENSQTVNTQPAQEKQSVLFLCTGNSARSQMGEAWLRHYAGNEFEVHSAGLDPSVVNPFTIQVMGEKGIDMSAHHAKSVREYLGKKEFTYVITVCSRAEDRCPSTFVGQLYRLHWPFDDPAAVQGSDEQKLAKFRQIRDEIEAKIKHWLDLAKHDRRKLTISKVT